MEGESDGIQEDHYFRDYLAVRNVNYKMERKET
jgi:hypothetical protein